MLRAPAQRPEGEAHACGEGIIDFIFTVDDLGKEIARLDARGVPVIFSGGPLKPAALLPTSTPDPTAGTL